ncbi:MAG TPA: HNH endonuclease signature motif containing protein [Planctomycetaceae bacterium]|nr:HNH endonuclease signature motif containing protein [Planctomycetaceae bacterium]
MALATLPILNPEIHTTRRMERWLRGRCTVRRMLRLELYLQDPFCAYCRRPLACPDAGVLDHATPRSQGGSDQPSNAMLSCRQCDRAKGRRTISEWKAALLAGLFSIGQRLDEQPPVDSRGEPRRV